MSFDATTEIDLSRYEPAYQAARAESNKPANPVNPAYAVPDGTYRVNVEDVSLGISPSEWQSDAQVDAANSGPRAAAPGDLQMERHQ